MAQQSWITASYQRLHWIWTGGVLAVILLITVPASSHGQATLSFALDALTISEDGTSGLGGGTFYIGSVPDLGGTGRFSMTYGLSYSSFAARPHAAGNVVQSFWHDSTTYRYDSMLYARIKGEKQAKSMDKSEPIHETIEYLSFRFRPRWHFINYMNSEVVNPMLGFSIGPDLGFIGGKVHSGFISAGVNAGIELRLSDAMGLELSYERFLRQHVAVIDNAPGYVTLVSPDDQDWYIKDVLRGYEQSQRSSYDEPRVVLADGGRYFEERLNTSMSTISLSLNYYY